MTYPEGFDPHEWHNHHRSGKPRWRVKFGMAEQRLRAIERLEEISKRMETENSFSLVDQWHVAKQAVLDCEENEQ